MAPKNNKPAAPKQPAAKVAPAAQPKVDPTSLSTKQIYSGEQERQAALAEVTNLRRQYDTTTAAGAKAFAKSKEAQAALARLDAAKSAVGMRTSAQDLQALNTVQGRGQTKALNQPSQQYFQSVYNRPDMAPVWQPPTSAFKKETVDQYMQQGYDIKDSYMTWVWSDADKQWKIKSLGAKYVGPIADPATAKPEEIGTIASQTWQSGKAGLSGFLDIFNRYQPESVKRDDQILGGPIGKASELAEIAKAIPDITWKEFSAVAYQAEQLGALSPADFIAIYEQLFGKK